jgi:hypothetical protein
MVRIHTRSTEMALASVIFSTLASSAAATAALRLAFAAAAFFEGTRMVDFLLCLPKLGKVEEKERMSNKVS